MLCCRYWITLLPVRPSADMVRELSNSDWGPHPGVFIYFTPRLEGWGLLSPSRPGAENSVERPLTSSNLFYGVLVLLVRATFAAEKTAEPVKG